MKLNKKVLMFFLLSVFAVGTLTFTDTVEAATNKEEEAETNRIAKLLKEVDAKIVVINVDFKSQYKQKDIDKIKKQIVGTWKANLPQAGVKSTIKFYKVNSDDVGEFRYEFRTSDGQLITITGVYDIMYDGKRIKCSYMKHNQYDNKGKLYYSGTMPSGTSNLRIKDGKITGVLAWGAYHTK